MEITEDKSKLPHLLLFRHVDYYYISRYAQLAASEPMNESYPEIIKSFFSTIIKLLGLPMSFIDIFIFFLQLGLFECGKRTISL